MRRGRIELKTWMAAAFLLLVFAAALMAPFVAHAADRVDLSNRLQQPSVRHWMGTDDLGRDVLERLLHGARISLLVAFISAAVSFLIGVTVGALAGYLGGATDWITMRFIEVTLCFPFFFLVLAIVAILGPSLLSIIVAIALTSWTHEARFVRGEMIRLKEAEFAWSARAAGAGGLRVAFHHLLPHAIAPAIVSAAFGVGIAILGESALSFLGFGVQLPMASWGSILSSADEHLGTAWWIALFPGLAIFLTVASVNVVADTLRQRLDPKMSNARM